MVGNFYSQLRDLFLLVDHPVDRGRKIARICNKKQTFMFFFLLTSGSFFSQYPSFHIDFSIILSLSGK